nr:MAG TPA: hypothetical protein [Caudoviricetes sp.]
MIGKDQRSENTMLDIWSVNLRQRNNKSYKGELFVGV